MSTEWKSLKLAPGGKLFKVHTFNLIHNGINFNLEVDEYNDGTFTGHGEHSTDKNFVIESVSGSDMKACLQALIKRIQSRQSG